jgi:Mrp family chromosome partitioning ATPase
MDADLRRPTVHRLFTCSNDSGVTNILGQRRRQALQDTAIENPKVLSAGSKPLNPANC